jgi:hypothetical protein
MLLMFELRLIKVFVRVAARCKWVPGVEYRFCVVSLYALDFIPAGIFFFNASSLRL